MRRKKRNQKTSGGTGANQSGEGNITVWGKGPFFLDASALAVPANGQHPIVDIATACRAIGLHLIPATPFNVSVPYQHGVQTVAATDNRGICLRVDLNGCSSAATWVQHWPFELENTDLVVDVGDNAPMVAGLGDAVTNVFRALYNAGQWRSVTIAGTSMPENFTGLVAGKHLIPRAAVRLWQ